MDIKQLLQESILAAANQAIADGVISAAQLPAIVLEVPPQKEFGDYATNFAMQTAAASVLAGKMRNCRPGIY
jgi:arginyl-tRNA synthetase